MKKEKKQNSPNTKLPQVLYKDGCPIKIWTNDIDQQCLQQVSNLSLMPFIFKHIAVMPDCHVGIGATIGSVIPTDGAIIPAAVGVDIGCGMNARKISLQRQQLPRELKKVRRAIESLVPIGVGACRRKDIPIESVRKLQKGLQKIRARHPAIDNSKWESQLGTLGGGNHFIEICYDESDCIWIMLHSGSRGIGNMIGRYFIALARKQIKKSNKKLPDPDLAYFPEGSRLFDDYFKAATWAQAYAFENRKVMMHSVLQALGENCGLDFQVIGEKVNCHHNYIDSEIHFGKKIWIARKGAIRAGEGDTGIIPGSMGNKSYIVRGLGNPESFYSCSHGAGRKMSRKEAKKRFSNNDLERQTEGVECRKDRGVIDEIPGAYKDIDTVMENQKDLVKIVYTLKQVICIKG
ncbi:RtcB family protein [Candidatus Riflebacteria bacterium]